jgi:hypothetical protein
MIIYLVGEYSDYGLFDMSEAKVFSSYEDAKAYAESHSGYHLDVIEFKVN